MKRILFALALSFPGVGIAAAQNAATVPAAVPPVPSAQRENLRVIVRGADYVDHVMKVANGEKVQPWFFIRRIGDDLFEVLALDGPLSIALATAADLKAMRIKPDAAWELARNQTSAKLPPLPEPAALLSEAAIFEGPEYMGSLLADTQVWQTVRDAIGPDLFATVISDQFVMVSLMGEGPGFDRLSEAVAADCTNAERCISPHVYRFEQGRWVIAR